MRDQFENKDRGVQMKETGQFDDLLRFGSSGVPRFPSVQEFD